MSEEDSQEDREIDFLLRLVAQAPVPPGMNERLLREVWTPERTSARSTDRVWRRWFIPTAVAGTAVLVAVHGLHGNRHSAGTKRTESSVSVEPTSRVSSSTAETPTLADTGAPHVAVRSSIDQEGLQDSGLAHPASGQASLAEGTRVPSRPVETGDPGPTQTHEVLASVEVSGLSANPSSQLDAAVPGQPLPRFDTGAIPGQVLPRMQDGGVPGHALPSFDLAAAPGTHLPAFAKATNPGDQP